MVMCDRRAWALSISADIAGYVQYGRAEEDVGNGARVPPINLCTDGTLLTDP